MPNSTQEHCCPKCRETVGNEDVMCSECGTELVQPEVPPGKKRCVNCPRILSVKAKFCSKCRAPQIPEKKKRTCCGEDLSDDDEFCCMCSKPWREESGSYKQTQEKISKVERESVGKDAAPEREGSTDTASAVIDQNEGKTDTTSKEPFPPVDAQSPIQQSHEAVELPSANTDIPEKPKESLSEQHAVSFVQGPERGEPPNSPSHAVISTGPTLDREDDRQLVQDPTASLCNVANEPVRQNPLTTSDESSDDSSHSMVSKHSSTDDNQNEEKTVVAPKTTAIFHEMLPPGKVSPKLHDLQQTFTKFSLQNADANKNEMDSIHSEDHQRSDSVQNSPDTIARETTESDKAGAENAQESRFSDVEQQTESDIKGKVHDQISDNKNAKDGMGDNSSRRLENESSRSAPVYDEGDADARTLHETHQVTSAKEDQMKSAHSREITLPEVPNNFSSTSHGNFNKRSRSSSANEGSSKVKVSKKDGDAYNQTLKENNADQLEQGGEIQNDDPPNNGKRRKSHRSVSESESGQGRYYLRSNQQAGTSSNADGPSTKVQLETSSVDDVEENKTPTLQKKAGGDVKETEDLKNFMKVKR